jgi:hypothetical protein
MEVFDMGDKKPGKQDRKKAAREKKPKKIY